MGTRREPVQAIASGPPGGGGDLGPWPAPAGPDPPNPHIRRLVLRAKKKYISKGLEIGGQQTFFRPLTPPGLGVCFVTKQGPAPARPQEHASLRLGKRFSVCSSFRHQATAAPPTQTQLITSIQGSPLVYATAAGPEQPECRRQRLVQPEVLGPQGTPSPIDSAPLLPHALQGHCQRPQKMGMPPYCRPG